MNRSSKGFFQNLSPGDISKQPRRLKILHKSASIQIPHCLCLQKKYREEADRTMSHYVPVLDTPEMQRVRENQKNFSTVSNKCKWWTMLALWEGQYVFERCRTYSMKSEDGVRWLRVRLRVCCKVLNFIESSWKLNVWCQFFLLKAVEYVLLASFQANPEQKLRCILLLTWASIVCCDSLFSSLFFIVIWPL